jgi:4-carboxymuconolactone decarboxylase
MATNPGARVPNDRAQAVHDELLPGHVSTLAGSDPELIEVFDNFAFDEVLRLSRLDIRTRLIVQLAAIVGCHAVREFRIMLGAALNVGVSPVEAREVVYQAVPYVGIARVLDCLVVMNEVFAERGIKVPLPGQSTTSPETRKAKGLAMMQRIVTEGVVESIQTNTPADQQHIPALLAANCFGDHLTRAGLDLATRELVTFSFLVSLGGCDPQVRGHVAANVNVGNDRARLIDVATQLLPFIGYPRTLNALRAIDDAAPAGRA